MTSLQTTFAHYKIPINCQYLVYGFIRHFLYSNNFTINIPDDVKKISLLFYYSIPEHFIVDSNNQSTFALHKKKQFVSHLEDKYAPLWNRHSSSREHTSFIYGSVVIEPFQNKKACWKFKNMQYLKASSNWSNIQIGIIATECTCNTFYSYAKNGRKYKSQHNAPDDGHLFGLSYGQNGYDLISMELDFSNGSDTTGILSFSRGIQLLKPAFCDLDRSKNYKMCISLIRGYYGTPSIELMEYNEYYVADNTSPWRKVCGYCQTPKVTKRCSACKKVYYCNTKCQRAHWKYVHRKQCKLIMN
eukprot:785087_1